jgi:hypothetical protein
MSSAFYIVLERKLSGIGLTVSGKALARSGEVLDGVRKIVEAAREKCGRWHLAADF